MNLQVLEAMHQTYRDRVNFLYAYVREAHPDPRYAPCGSTRTLGWTHPSADTRWVGERAQRARWLKNEYDLTFPVFIDQMDNPMKNEYFPFGFYVAWIIDCDGRVVQFEPWAWATADTQWCGLPLADFADFEAFLEGYLADPPPCYRGIERGPFAYLVPAAAHLDGLEGTAWVTDLTLSNPGGETAAIGIELRPRGEASAPPPRYLDEIPPGSTLELADVVASTFAFAGAAAVAVESDQPLVVVSRTVNQTEDGSFGQLIRGYPARRALGDEAVGHLLGLEESPDFRSNLGMASLSAFPVTVRVELFDSLGVAMGSLDLEVPALGATQIDRVLRHATSSEVLNARAVVTVTTPGGRALVYASLVDNRTGDPTFLETLLSDYSVDIVIPAAAHTPGFEGTTWVSDLVLHNALQIPVEATILPLSSAQGATAATAEADLQLQPFESRRLMDVVGETLEDTGAQALLIHGSDGLMATSRTFNAAANGTFGQLVPGVDVTGRDVLRPGVVGHLVQLDQSTEVGRRTNLGLVNVRHVATTVEVRFFSSDGLELGRISRELGARSFLQLDRVLELLDVGEISNARAEVRVLTGGGRVIAYASSIDNRTGDPVFQLAWLQSD